MGNELSKEEFQLVLPKKVRKSVSQELIDQINTTISDPVILESFRDNLLGFSSVMTQGKFKLPNYICAVKYVSFKLMGDTNVDAYIKAFPGKYTDFITNGVSRETITTYASAYNKTKLVVLIFEQSLMPTHLVNAPLYQKALNVQASIMMNPDASFKVQSDAAAHIMNVLKPPETQKIELDIGVKEDDSIQALRETTMELARQQREMIQRGQASSGTIAASNLIGLKEDDYEEAEIAKN